LLAACGSGSPLAASHREGTDGGANAGAALSGQLTVFAASSLTDAFEDLGERFTQTNPDNEVAFNFGSSSTLATQIVQGGAPADVFASASQTPIEIVADAQLLADEPQTFASNTLEIAVEPGNPLDIQSLEDLARPDVTTVLAAEEVPAGAYARQALDDAGIQVSPASLEVDVRAVLSRVALGEAAGIVYVSDVVAAGDSVQGVPIPPERNVPASYPVAALAEAANPRAAEAFVDFVLSDEAQAVLDKHGFSAP
jgi:molybdate transport system substrate-binding protein